MKQQVTPKWIEKCKAYVDKLIEPIRITARAHGYAIGVHGSLKRDIDLIAVPWSQEASTPKTLADAIQDTIIKVHGIAINKDATDPNGAETGTYFLQGCPGGHPHGRRSWTFHLGGGPYIDLAIFPPDEHQQLLDIEEFNRDFPEINDGSASQ